MAKLSREHSPGNQSVSFNYLYRDAANYKKWGSVVFDNPKRRTVEELTATTQRILGPRSPFPDVLQFRPERVKLPTLFLYEIGSPTVDDVDFHEFFSIETSTAKPDDPSGRSIDEFLRKLERSCAGDFKWADPAVSDAARPGQEAAESIERAKALVRPYLKPGESMSRELIKERRQTGKG